MLKVKQSLINFFRTSTKFHIFMAVTLIILITNSWFSQDKIIGNVDIYFFNDKFGEFLQRFSNYSSIRGGGQNYATQIPGSAITLFNWIIQNLTNNLLITQKIYFIFLNIAVTFSIFFFLKKIQDTENIQTNNFLIFFVTFLITFNPYFSFVWVRLQSNLLSVSWVFLSFALLIDAINKRGNYRSNLVFFTLLSFLIGWTNGVQPPIFQIWFYTFLIIGIYYGIKLKELKKSFTLILWFIFIFLITNLWWIYPIIDYVKNNNLYNSEILASQYNIKDLIFGTSKFLSFLNISNFIGDFAWFEDYLPAIIPYRTSSFYLILNSAQILIIYMYIFEIFLKAKRKIYYNTDIFWFALLLIFLLLSSGAHPPFGNLYLYFSENIFALGLQRAPWQKFTLFVLVPLSILTLRSILNLFSYIGKVKANHVQVYLKTIILLSLLPVTFLTASGKMFNLGVGNYGFHEKNGFGFHLETPEYVFESIKFLNDQIEKDFGDILLLPASRAQAYNWGYGGPVDLIVTSSIKSGVITPEYGEGTSSRSDIQELNNQLFKEIGEGRLDNFVKYAQELNIKYIINRNDFNLKFYSGDFKPGNRNEIHNLLIGSQNIEFMKSFKEWDIYKIQNGKNLIEMYRVRNNLDLEIISYFGKVEFHRKIPSLIYVEPGISTGILELNEYEDRNWIAFGLNLKNRIGFSKLDRANYRANENSIFSNYFLVKNNYENIVIIYFPSFVTYILLILSILNAIFAIRNFKKGKNI